MAIFIEKVAQWPQTKMVNRVNCGRSKFNNDFSSFKTNPKKKEKTFWNKQAKIKNFFRMSKRAGFERGWRFMLESLSSGGTVKRKLREKFLERFLQILSQNREGKT